MKSLPVRKPLAVGQVPLMMDRCRRTLATYRYAIANHLLPDRRKTPGLPKSRSKDQNRVSPETSMPRISLRHDAGEHLKRLRTLRTQLLGTTRIG